MQDEKEEEERGQELVGSVEGKARRTELVVVAGRLVMLSSELRPSCEVILGTDAVQRALQPHDLAAQTYLVVRGLRGRSWKFVVEEPELRRGFGLALCGDLRVCLVRTRSLIMLPPSVLTMCKSK